METTRRLKPTRSTSSSVVEVEYADSSKTMEPKSTRHQDPPQPHKSTRGPRCLPAISSMSLGRAWNHALAPKLEQAAEQGFKGIEMFEEDLLTHASTLFPEGTELSEHRKLLLASMDVARICNRLGLQILCFQPFRSYEGLRSRTEHAERVAEMRRWLTYATSMGTDLIAIASTFLSEEACSGDVNLIVSDMREVADLGAKHNPPIRFTYEALCWGTHVASWEDCWDIVEKVDRSNFGMCVDTFNMAGYWYADPARESGCVEDADNVFEQSMQRFRDRVDPKKVFYVQLVDAEKLDKPLVEGHEFYNADQDRRMSWSRNCRLFYGEAEWGAYLPISKIAKILFEDLGYNGWVSMEFFNRSCAEKGEKIPEEHAKRAIQSWRRLKADFPVITELMATKRSNSKVLDAARNGAGFDIEWARTDIFA